MTAFWRLSAAELLAGYGRRAFSPVEVTREQLERIERMNGRLGAYLVVDHEGAMASARIAEAAWMQAGDKPLLCGVPAHVKDTIEMAGFPTTYGSLAFRENVQPDAEIVVRLRTAGAVILGKTNTPEFALSPRTENRLGPPAVNPWDLLRTCGGSTGGGAAAVAAGLGPLCIGSDSAGSVRLPAAYQGIFALKPSFQRIPAVQRWRASPGRSHNGPITRTVGDTALMMQALAGPHRDDPDSARYPAADYLSIVDGSVNGARVAVSHTFGRDVALEPDQAQNVRSRPCATSDARSSRPIRRCAKTATRSRPAFGRIRAITTRRRKISSPIFGRNTPTISRHTQGRSTRPVSPR